MSKYNKYTKEEIQQIIEFYKNHSLKETGAQFNISSGLVKRILIENNQSLRNKSESSKLGLVKYKKTSLDKYGVEFPAQAEEVKEKYDNYKQRVKRKDFYLKNGFKEMDFYFIEFGVRYEMLYTGKRLPSQYFDELMLHYVGEKYKEYRVFD